MNKETYYFQTPPEDGDFRWDEQKPIQADFSTREDAVQAAKLLSQAFGDREIRLANNSNYKHNSGAYINGR